MSLGHHHHHHHRASLTTRAALASVCTALFLLVLKAFAALETGSVAMLGSLADTSLDLLASLARARGRVKSREQLIETLADRNYDGLDRSM